MGSNNYTKWIEFGDNWLTVYLSETFDRMPTPLIQQFALAHAMELYFKACISKKYGDKKALSYNHKCFNMYCKLKIDKNFLPDLNISRSIYDRYSISCRKIDKAYLKEVLPVQEYLFLWKYSVNLKYPVFQKMDGEKSYPYVYPDYYKGAFFFGIRQYLRYDQDKNQDILESAYTKWSQIPDRLNQDRAEFLRYCLGVKMS